MLPRGPLAPRRADPSAVRAADHRPGSVAGAIDDTVIDGLAVWSRALGDLRPGRQALALYRASRDAVVAGVGPGETCRVAFSAAEVGPHRHGRVLVVVLADRAILAPPSRRGSPWVDTLSLSDVRRTEWRVGTNGAHSGVSLLSVGTSDQELVFALSGFRPRAADLLRDSFRAITH